MKFFSFIFISLLFLFSCRKDKVKTIQPEGDCTEEKSFQEDILPILSNNCSTSGCHDANGQSGGYIFETHDQISQNADKILAAMRHETQPLMPQGGEKLEDSLSINFECWIEQGKLDN
ncbi:MAG: hypothetical protein WED10_10715 [Brumimicrobium sp.]